MLRRVALVRADVSEERSATFIRVTRIGELGTTLAVASNRRTLRRNLYSSFYQLIFIKILELHDVKRPFSDILRITIKSVFYRIPSPLQILEVTDLSVTCDFCIGPYQAVLSPSLARSTDFI
jgi:hypothetical protein